MIRTCPICKQNHPSGATQSNSRFSRTPPLYRATYPDSPTRDTREEAKHDYCQWWQKRNTK